MAQAMVVPPRPRDETSAAWRSCTAGGAPRRRAPRNERPPAVLERLSRGAAPSATSSAPGSSPRWRRSRRRRLQSQRFLSPCRRLQSQRFLSPRPHLLRGHLRLPLRRRAQLARGPCPLATWETLRGEPTAACGPAPRRAQQRRRGLPRHRGPRVRRLRLRRRPDRAPLVRQRLLHL